MAKYPGVPVSVIRRLPRYYRYLQELQNQGVKRISSREFAEMIDVTASQIRQDLNCFGGFGQQGYGYNVENLHKAIGTILGLDQKKPTILLGVGNLGLALANHINFEERGFELLGIFDNDPKKIGKKAGDITIQSSDGLAAFCAEHHPEIAILCVPQEAAAEIASLLTNLGVRGFWNFSHYDLSILHNEGIVVENVHLGDSLMTLSFQTSQL